MNSQNEIQLVSKLNQPFQDCQCLDHSNYHVATTETLIKRVPIGIIAFESPDDCDTGPPGPYDW